MLLENFILVSRDNPKAKQNMPRDIPRISVIDCKDISRFSIYIHRRISARVVNTCNMVVLLAGNLEINRFVEES